MALVLHCSGRTKGFNGIVKEIILRILNIKRLAAASALGLFALLGTSTVANAQNRNADRKAMKQEQKIARQQAKIEAQRARLMQQRQAEWARRNGQLVVRRTNGTGYYTLQTDSNIAPPGRYRVNRDGRWYNTDNRGADLLRQAINEGYRQGFNAGRSDYSGNRRGSWSNSNVYRTGTYGYQNGVDRGQYQYYFRQGFQRGYQDGSNSQYQEGHNGNFQYGTYNNGTPSILGTILNQLLNIQSY
jgi:hypothetical protein